MSSKPGWMPSATLPKKRTSLVGVGYDAMVARARALVPSIAARAQECERLRRLPDETERDLHAAGLFRIAQPARVGGPELDVGIFVDVCAEIAKVCPSTAWNIGNLASHHWMLAYYDPKAQDELWDVSPDVLIATSLVFPAGRGRKVDGGSPRVSTIPTGTCWPSWCARRTTAHPSTSASPSSIARTTRSSTPGMPWASRAPARRTLRSKACSCRPIGRSRRGT